MAKVYGNIDEGIYIYITRTIGNKNRFTVHVFVSPDKSAVTNTLLTACKEKNGIITESTDINDGLLHQSFHDYADAAFSQHPNTTKYSSTSHCHIEASNPAGGSFIAAVFINNKILSLAMGTELAYKLSTPKNTLAGTDKTNRIEFFKKYLRYANAIDRQNQGIPRADTFANSHDDFFLS